MIRGSAGCLGIDPTKPKLGQIEFFDEDSDRPPQRSASSDPPANHTRILSRESKQAMRFYTGWTNTGRSDFPTPRPPKGGLGLRQPVQHICWRALPAHSGGVGRDLDSAGTRLTPEGRTTVFCTLGANGNNDDFSMAPRSVPAEGFLYMPSLRRPAAHT
jgi:hypothetical protein